MTNPSNAAEKPATGCGCDPKGNLCPEGERLREAAEEAWRRKEAARIEMNEAADRWSLLWDRLRELSEAYRTHRAHVEASNG